MRRKQMFFLPLLLSALALVFWVIFFYRGETKYDKMVKDFTDRAIKGNIIVSKEATRGSYFIQIKDSLSNANVEYLLPKSWFFKENQIQVGDYVIKESNSKFITFYKLKNGMYKKCCEYEIGM